MDLPASEGQYQIHRKRNRNCCEWTFPQSPGFSCAKQMSKSNIMLLLNKSLPPKIDVVLVAIRLVVIIKVIINPVLIYDHRRVVLKFNLVSIWGRRVIEIIETVSSRQYPPISNETSSTPTLKYTSWNTRTFGRTPGPTTSEWLQAHRRLNPRISNPPMLLPSVAPKLSTTIQGHSPGWELNEI